MAFSSPYIQFEPSFSNDFYRYVWEGKIQNFGFNPYTCAPDDEKLIYLRDDTYEKVDHKKIPAIYPPLTQLLFKFLSIFDINKVILFKCFFIFFALLSILIFYQILIELKREHLLPLFALNPIIYFETGLNAHFDIVGVAVLLLAILFILKKQTFSPALLGAFVFLIKYLPFVFLGFFLGKIKNKKMFFSIITIMICIFFLPFFQGINTFFTLGNFSKYWQFNGSLYKLLLGIFENDSAVRIILSVLFVFSFLIIYKMEKPCFTKAAYFSLCIIILSPVVYPWYLLWFLPFAVIAQEYVLIIFSILVMFSYWIVPDFITSGIWKENVAVSLVQYIPFYTLILILILGKRFARIEIHSNDSSKTGNI
jgi:hypothetical protein